MQTIETPPTTKAIHPLAIFKQGLSVYKKNFRLFGRIFLFVYPLAVIMQVMQVLLSSNIQTATALVTIYSLLIYGLIFLIESWGYIALTLAADHAVKGVHSGILQTIGEAKNYFLPYLGTMLLYSLVIFPISLLVALSFSLTMAGAMQLNNWLLIIPPVIFLIILLFVFVYFFIRLSLSGVVCIIDKLGPVGALKQSRRVIKPFVTPVVGAGGLFILFALLSYVPFTAVSAAFKNANPTHMSLWGVGYMFLANILLAPTCAIIFVILYHKLKEPI